MGLGFGALESVTYFGAEHVRISLFFYGVGCSWLRDARLILVQGFGRVNFDSSGLSCGFGFRAFFFNKLVLLVAA